MTNIPTNNQILTSMSQLLDNYTELSRNMYNFFYNTTPMDISLELYDSNGVLQTYVVPNRAKDLKYVTNGSGSPEGIVTADVGTVYSDTTNGVLYMKVLSSGSNTGWVVLATLNALQDILS